MMEKILAVPSEKARKFFPTGFGKTDEKELLGFVSQEGLFYDRTPEMETHPSLMQIIPYILVRNKDKILMYQRLSKQTEKRLHSKYSIGFGGHINPEDSQNVINPVISGRDRELREEVILTGAVRYMFMGTLYLPVDSVGKVHAGMVYAAETDSEEFRLGEPDKFSSVGWHSVDEILSKQQEMETWSRELCEELFRKTPVGR